MAVISFRLGADLFKELRVQIKSTDYGYDKLTTCVYQAVSQTQT